MCIDVCTPPFADRQDAVEHRLQVPRGVGQLHHEDVLAQFAALPGGRQGADAQVPGSAQRVRDRGGGRQQPEKLGETVVQAAQTEAQVGQVAGGG